MTYAHWQCFLVARALATAFISRSETETASSALTTSAYTRARLGNRKARHHDGARHLVHQSAPETVDH
eukprot:CAMPEP_0171986984 /NCGR_PEP_ID=MMETSP0993-20121228/275154_1 /TAXON_ID=483369 /ORGANISM="non described non described, Strain CCMP2098" /LENGTH=67 /DNA_ID=CAMNT_0012639909 /DNA_START=683 /DNA_END=886 /DNA_ORIENTATION=+